LGGTAYWPRSRVPKSDADTSNRANDLIHDGQAPLSLVTMRSIYTAVGQGISGPQSRIPCANHSYHRMVFTTNNVELLWRIQERHDRVYQFCCDTFCSVTSRNFPSATAIVAGIGVSMFERRACAHGHRMKRLTYRRPDEPKTRKQWARRNSALAPKFARTRRIEFNVGY